MLDHPLRVHGPRQETPKEFLQNPGHAHHVMQNDHVGHKVVVLDHLALLVPDVLRNDPLSSKK